VTETESTDAEPLIIGGPTSVVAQLESDASKGDQGLLAPLRDQAQTLYENSGLRLGLDYTALWQGATASLDEQNASSGVFRFYGDWTLLGRGTDNAGAFVFKVENRHQLGIDIAPQALAGEIGYAGLTATTYSDAGWILTNFQWKQYLFDGRLAFVAGIVDTTDYVDTYALLNPWTDFMNAVFENVATMPAPNQGPGAAAQVRLTDNFYVMAGFADANGDPANTFEAFDSISEGEFFTHAEFGWAASYEKRYSDNYHITLWHNDERTDAQKQSGWGTAVSFTRRFGERWQPFLRAGYADRGGALLEWSVSTGIGCDLREHGFLGVGVNWGRPSESTFGSDLDDQFTLESYYRWQVTSFFAVSPSIQILVDPALNPDEDVIAVFCLRARIAF
jgi:porin